MKHTIKLLTLAFMLATILTLTGCPEPVNNYIEPPVWDDGVVTTEPTCTEDGVKTYTCSNGETRTETIPALGHNWVLESDTATCTTVGVKTYKCSRCNEIRTEDNPALGHNFEGGYCERCGEYEFENYRYTIKVFTSRGEFLKELGFIEETTEGNNTLNNTPYEEVHYSFESGTYISVNELLSLKSRFRGKNIIMAYDYDYYGNWGNDLPSGADCWSLDDVVGSLSSLVVLISNE